MIIKRKIFSLLFSIIFLSHAQGALFQSKKKAAIFDVDQYTHLLTCYQKHAFVDDSAFYYLNRMAMLTYAAEKYEQYAKIEARIVGEYLNRNSPQVISYSDSILPVLRKYNQPDVVINIIARKVNYYICNYQFQNALDVIELLQKEADVSSNNYYRACIAQMLGDLYSSTDHYQLAVDSYEKGYHYLLGDTVDYYLLTAINLCNEQISTLYQLKDYRKMLEISAVGKRLINRAEQLLIPQEKMLVVRKRLFLNSLRVLAYSSLHQLDQASPLIDSLKKFQLNELELGTSIEYLHAFVVYYRVAKNYTEAMRYLDLADSLPALPLLNKETFLAERVKVLEYQRQFEKSYYLLQSLNAIRDSLKTAKFEGQLKEVNLRVQIADVNSKVAGEKLKVRNLYIVLIVLFCILVVYRIYFFSMKKRNKLLLFQLKQVNHLEKKLSFFKVDSQVSETDNKTVMNQIFIEIERCMNEEKIYTKSSLYRETLAEMFQVSPMELGKIIQDHTQLSFSEYLNGYRLDHARTLIFTNKHSSIKEIYGASGFTSKTTFYRLFSERFGMTPSDLRLLLEEGEKDDNQIG